MSNTGAELADGTRDVAVEKLIGIDLRALPHVRSSLAAAVLLVALLSSTERTEMKYRGPQRNTLVFTVFLCGPRLFALCVLCV
jgi:hypothetical protein